LLHKGKWALKQVAKSWPVKVLIKLLAKQTAAFVNPNVPRAVWHAAVLTTPTIVPIRPVDGT
jgi:hypothetical protein